MFWMTTNVEKAFERSSFEIDVLVAVQCTMLAVRLVHSGGFADRGIPEEGNGGRQPTSVFENAPNER